jgi:hypothetical protein
MAPARSMYENPMPLMAPVASASAVEVADLVALVSGNVVAAASFTWNTSLSQTQTDFAAAFLGASAQKKIANVAQVAGNSAANLMRIDTAGVFEFDCTSATYAVGDLVGPAKDTGNNLLSQKVEAVSASEARAIGRVVEAGSSLTRVKVRLLSKIAPTARQS